MLQKLTISNYALIEHLEMAPGSGMITITGETGAGKSILLGALGLLMGNRADTKVLFDAERKCLVEAEFRLEDMPLLRQVLLENDLDVEPVLTIRREISNAGKSRAFVNDTPVNLEVVRIIADLVINIHSQHETLLLGNADFQLSVIDVFAHNEEERKQYDEAYRAWKAALSKKKAFEETLRKQQEDQDYNTFQLKEFERMEITSQEQFDAVEEELQLSENAELIQQRLAESEQLLQGHEAAVLPQLDELKRALQGVQQYSKELEEFTQRVEAVRLELQDVARELERKAAGVEFDPNRIEWLRTQLDMANGLMHKHRCHDFTALLAVRAQLQQAIDQVEQADEHLVALSKQEAQTRAQAQERAHKLTETRVKAGTVFTNSIEEQLASLGMPNGRVIVTCDAKDMASSGADDIAFLFSANKGIQPERLQKVASGGELSRLMFAIKYLMAGKANLPTFVFDEIDTGISGEIAIKMGRMMKKMSERHQVITITHLPQVAALGSEHYKVYKEESSEIMATRVQKLEQGDREKEIAKMISGDNPSESAYINARELLSLGTF